MTPTVSVITATYNWPSALKLAMHTALSQSFTDFEYLVIGDACDDETEEVVRSFKDPRIIWHNLPENTGNQAGPSQAGVERARGRLIAYLNQDDLWFSDHLEILVKTLDGTQADFVNSLCIDIAPPGNRYRGVMGLPKAREDGTSSISPVATTVMHTATAAREAGGWRDWRTLVDIPTVDFFKRLSEGRVLGFSPLVTALKFHSSDRPGSYVSRVADEQAEYLARMRADPQLRHRLLALVALSQSLGDKPPWEGKFGGVSGPGLIIERHRMARGLSPMLDQG